MQGRTAELEAQIEGMQKAVYGNPTEEALEQGEKTEAADVVEERPSEPVQATEPAAPQEDTVEVWKKRYSGLKSHHDTKMFSMNQEISSLGKQNQQLNQRLDALQKQLTSQATKRDVYKNALTDEQKDILGEDAVTGMKSVTEAAVKAAVGPLQQQIQQLQQTNTQLSQGRQQNAAQQAEQGFRGRLGQLAPDFAKFDTDPKFIAFMKGSNTELFKAAHRAGDVERVAQFFNAYKATLPKETGKQKLAKKVAPTTTAAAAPAPTEAPKGYMTMQEVNDFRQAVIRGHYRGTNKERMAMERKIDEAHFKGLIR